MISLLINTSECNEGPSLKTRFGGQPSVPNDHFDWPTCATCGGNMQFLGQLAIKKPDHEYGLLLLFLCQNDPGMCDDWDPNAGGNKVIPVESESLQLADPPEEGDVVRPLMYGATIVDIEDEQYDESRIAYCESTGMSTREVLGQIGGRPSWIQGEEIPSCDSCNSPMSFVAQLEEGPDWKTAMNFGGGGCAYVYQCHCVTHSAKMLWQC